MRRTNAACVIPHAASSPNSLKEGLISMAPDSSDQTHSLDSPTTR